MRRTLLASLTLALASLLPAAGLADVIMLSQGNCPAGSVGRFYHSGRRCEPDVCVTDRECDYGMVCRDGMGLCLVSQEKDYTGIDGKVRSAVQTRVTGICQSDDHCASGSCVVARRCVDADWREPADWLRPAEGLKKPGPTRLAAFVGETPVVCPPGSERQLNRSGSWCEPQTCAADGACSPGLECRPAVGLCADRTEVPCRVLNGLGAEDCTVPLDYTRAACQSDADCADGACEVSARCVDPTRAAATEDDRRGCRRRRPAGAAVFVLISSLPLLGSRRRRRESPRQGRGPVVHPLGVTRGGGELP